ncbi:hypothetical protein [Gelidibacter gilvus]|uniref:hypothetical protein n=1 Tax=Gelidibacter gilvus TaxID=59602 RepID=UPI00167DD649|nr:hypothetical protein [Gelidibacter gilvus]
MTDKKNEEFDPEKHKDIKKGPLKPEHKNQYGEKPGGKDRDLAKRAEAEEKRHKK